MKKARDFINGLPDKFLWKKMDNLTNIPAEEVIKLMQQYADGCMKRDRECLVDYLAEKWDVNRGEIYAGNIRDIVRAPKLRTL